MQGIEQRCLFMLQDAIGLEEKGQTDEALEMYLNAAEMCLEAVEIPYSTRKTNLAFFN